MQSWDAVIVGGGIIGLSLAISLRKHGLSVLVVERSEPGHEASSAAAGMLADSMMETPKALQPLASASARMYPEFAHELEDESGENVDLRDFGTIVFPSPGDRSEVPSNSDCLLPQAISDLEPGLSNGSERAFLLKERSVDPGALVAAALKAARHRGVDVASGSTVTGLLLEQGRAAGVRTDKTKYPSGVVINCAGAWAGQISSFPVPVRPVKGQMLCVIDPTRALLRHVIRSHEVYLVPRSDGRIVIGATIEEAGFDKRTDPDTIQSLHQAAIRMLPGIKHSLIHDAWAGLRPGTPDVLPILGPTDITDFFVATGHYRDGILLAPITAHLIAQLITSQPTDYNLSAFSPGRFVALKRA